MLFLTKASSKQSIALKVVQKGAWVSGTVGTLADRTRCGSISPVDGLYWTRPWTGWPKPWRVMFAFLDLEQTILFLDKLLETQMV